MLGTVKWFNVVRGFGFIIGDDGNEYFFHYSNIKGEGVCIKPFFFVSVKLFSILI